MFKEFARISSKILVAIGLASVFALTFHSTPPWADIVLLLISLIYSALGSLALWQMSQLQSYAERPDISSTTNDRLWTEVNIFKRANPLYDFWKYAFAYPLYRFLFSIGSVSSAIFYIHRLSPNTFLSSGLENVSGLVFLRLVVEKFVEEITFEAVIWNFSNIEIARNGVGILSTVLINFVGISFVVGFFYTWVLAIYGFFADRKMASNVEATMKAREKGVMFDVIYSSWRPAIFILFGLALLCLAAAVYLALR